MQQMAEITMEFKKLMADKTLSQNKNPFTKELEKETCNKLIQLARIINNDPVESEGEGSLSFAVLLMTTCLAQRNKINMLEYANSLIDKKIKVLIQKLY